jgi:type III secretion protein U
MANKDQSEEKKLPATRRKLDDARKKGQVSRSKDMVSGVGLALIVGYLLFSSARIERDAASLLTAALDASLPTAASTISRSAAATLSTDALASGLRDVLPVVLQATLFVLGPLFALLLAGAVVTNLVVLRGIPFSVDPIVPKMERISPVEGFKRLLQLRAVMEFVKSLAKMTALAVALVVILALGLQSLMDAPSCGLPCELQVLHTQLAQMLVAAAILFLVAGLIDVWLQRWLFLRDQRMSVTEAKRERKDMEGDPQIKGQRRRLIREAATGGTRGGLANATLVVCRPGVAAVGLRFKQGETPVPSVVARGGGHRASQLVAQAAQQGIPVLEDPALAETLLRRTKPGSFVPEDTYPAVAQALVQLGLI